MEYYNPVLSFDYKKNVGPVYAADLGVSIFGKMLIFSPTKGTPFFGLTTEFFRSKLL